MQLARVCAIKSVGVETKQLCELEPQVGSTLLPETSGCRWRCKSAGGDDARGGDREVSVELHVATVGWDLTQHVMVKATPSLMLTDPTVDVELVIMEEPVYETAQRSLNAETSLCLLPHWQPETTAQLLHLVAIVAMSYLADRSSQAKVVLTLINSPIDHRATDLSESDCVRHGMIAVVVGWSPAKCEGHPMVGLS